MSLKLELYVIELTGLKWNANKEVLPYLQLDFMVLEQQMVIFKEANKVQEWAKPIDLWITLSRIIQSLVNGKEMLMIKYHSE